MTSPTFPRHGAERPTADDRLIGERLRRLRCLKGKSQAEVGAAIGVTFQAVQKYENGEVRLAASKIATLARLFTVSIAYFLIGDEAVLDAPEPILLSNHALVLAGRIERLTHNHRRAVITLVNALSAEVPA